jgi:CspA family cold shock protein
MPQQGIVTWFNEFKSYEFIKPDEGPDIFVHISALDAAEIDMIDTDDRVEFEVATNTKNGRPMATALRLLAEG